MIPVDLINQSSIYFDLFLCFSFLLLGAGIKYVDDAFDEKTFNKTIALILAPLLGIYWVFIMSLNPVTSTILLSIVLGVLFKGKIDNIAHIMGFLSIVVLLVLFNILNFLFIPLILLTITGIADEVGNDFVDKKKYLFENHTLNYLTYKFFDLRFAMKTMAFILFLTGFYSVIYFVAFICFDLGYHLMTIRSIRLQDLRKFSYISTGKII